jgi:prophage regulatory protein
MSSAPPNSQFTDLFDELHAAGHRDKLSDRIVRIRSILDRAGLNRSTVYRKIQEGTFPQSVKLGEHARGWRESELNRWIADPTSHRR